MSGPLLDASGLVREWTGTLTDLIGVGHPVTNGFHLTMRDSPGHATFGVLTDLPQTVDSTGTMGWAQVSASIWGPTKQAASAAAVAYANAVLGLAGRPYVTEDGRRLICAGDVSVLESPDRGHPRYVVDAQFTIAAA